MSGKLLTTPSEIQSIFPGLKRIAVLGIKTIEQQDQPAYEVPEYLHEMGYDIIPVPVYYPEVTQILGEKVYRKLADVPGKIDLVDVFRKASDLMPHLEDIIASKPKTVWLQKGIRDDDFAKKLTDAGIDVVQDHCLMVEENHWRRTQNG